MTEKRQKLPLPTGQKTAKKAPKALALLIGLALVAAAAAYLAFAPKAELHSGKAYLSAAAVEIRVLVPGKVEYAAKAGQPVSAGEAVLRMDSSAFKKAAQEAESVVGERAGAVPQRSRTLMLRYLSIPQSEAELDEAAQKAALAEKEQKNELDALSERQAVFGLELRRLELKQKRLPEEEARMESMRLEEDLLRSSLAAAHERFTVVSLERAAAERQLQNKRELARALRSLPGQQREQLYALEMEFHKMYEAERQIALATSSSPQSGRVMFAALASGDSAREGDTALYILPEGQNAIWVTAYFSPGAAKQLQAGKACTVTIAADTPLVMQGTLAERLPYTEGQDGDIPFKVQLTNLDTDKFIGLPPGLNAQVSLNQ